MDYSNARDNKSEFNRLLSLSPENWKRNQVDVNQRANDVGNKLLNFQLDLKITTFAFFHVRQELMLSDHRGNVVTEGILEKALSVVTDSIDGDNHAGINRTLHRLSVLTGHSGKPMGVTLRVGWHVLGVGYFDKPAARGIAAKVFSAGSRTSNVQENDRDLRRFKDRVREAASRYQRLQRRDCWNRSDSHHICR